ncbi:PEP-utilizing enzyme [Gordonia amicalis]|uniref:PEP/pyruvate-binding domain-containing protein n=1 Tax=Gordonia amicalis TaxID=89053 RepID=UPI0004270B36|nr:PEP/pyruvate-binding domain-containing protein [Gordonia amicalis]MCZ4650568.1 PEP-utilizing enzyme [Gordonia amicalis]
MEYVVPFENRARCENALVGGKGANLAELVAAGFDVPGGFVVSTEAYRAALESAGVTDRIVSLVDGIDYDNIAQLDQVTTEIRQVIEAVEIPAAMREQVAQAYSALGDDVRVAVRSSGTAEDTADASFAGLHDTLLEIVGVEDVLDAVRDCWASMWTARAVSYRKSNGFDHATASIAVVVQTMVPSELSGVMFTANPLSARTDELVINASYGLGEAIVSGIVTPDEYVVSGVDLSLRRTHIGDKALTISVRAAGSGTETKDTPEADRSRRALSDEQIAELAALGREVQRHYDGLPQDIEWGYAGGKFYLLQARPITGVDFTWDECVDDWQLVPEDDDALWTFKYSEQYWTGGITPLFYSVRARESHEGIMRMTELAGFRDLVNKRTYKYKFGTAYYSVDWDEPFQRYALPRSVREGGSFNIPEDIRVKTLSEPLDVKRWFRMICSINSSPTSAFYNWKKNARRFIFTPEEIDKANGLPDAELRKLSDDALHRYERNLQEQAIRFMDSLWVGTHVQNLMVFGAFGQMVAKYYKGTNALIGQELMSGLPTNLQSQETHEFFRLSELIRNSAELRRIFDENPGPQFFTALEDSAEGREFLEQYRAFMAEHGHRGHADRDICFTRRADDANIDYEAFRMYLQVENPTTPAEQEQRVIAKREAAFGEVMEFIGQSRFGKIAQQVFKFLYDEVIDFLVLREDWRHYIDRITFAKRKAFLEVGRRAVERGLLETVEDAFFLSENELFALLAGGQPERLVRAKISGRRKAFDKMNSRMFTPPMLLRGNDPVPEESDDVEGGSQFTGIGTSGGVIEGVARVMPSMSQIAELQPGEILVCNATDPGWAPVFSIIGGLIIETGGMLAHGSCLSREHGIPAVQLVGGMRLIPNGARVRINGTTGQVDILADEPVAEALEVGAGA